MKLSFDREALREKVFTRRALFITALQGVLLTVLGGRLAWLQVSQGEKYKTLSDNNRINLKMLRPSRGEIVDRYGVPLALNNVKFSIQIVPEQTSSIEESLKTLSKYVTLPKRAVEKVLKKAKKSPSYVPIMVKDNIDWKDVATVEAHVPVLPGISISSGQRRIYPLKHSTAHLIGYVGAVNKTNLAKDKDPVLRLPDFRIGKTGLEKSLDSELRGSPGNAKVEVNVVGREVREIDNNPATEGERIKLTIDADLQRFVQEKLSHRRSASAVVMDIHTGAVYASASHPSFDPNDFTLRLPQDIWEELLSNTALPLNNKASGGLYPPGSTFKMLTALAALKAGLINENTTSFCPGYYEYGRDRFHCWKKHGHGTMNLEGALRESCDVYFYKVATEVGIDRIADMARQFGLDAPVSINIPDEKAGLMPDKNWKLGNIGEKWQPGESIVASIGQGYIQTTPLQLATMTARLANGGYAVRPWIVGYVGSEFQVDEHWPKLDISKRHLDLVKRGMDAVVMSEKGTARGSRINIEGMEMGGKTGTAQVRRITMQQREAGIKNSSLPWKYRHHALFVGYAPLHKPRYACAVVVEHGGGGSTSAAPLAKDILLEVQKRSPEKVKLSPVMADHTSLNNHPSKRPDTGGG